MQALSSYCITESRVIPEEKPTWEIVAELLKLAGQQIIFGEDEPILGELALAVKQHTFQASYVKLNQIIAEVIASLKKDKYTLADILEAIRAYANAQSTEFPEQKHSWVMVASLLRLAANQAQVEDRELP